jgi:surface polysaccharide O-acyltransferase-like enzyme
MNNKRQLRQSNIELLRIISFALIAALHSVGWYRSVNTSVNDYNWLFANGLNGIALGAVGCFMLITGYFYDTAKARIKRILMPALAYLLMYFAYFFILDYRMTSVVQPLKELARNLITNDGMFGHYWYVQCLLLITLLSPLFKTVIEKIDQKTHLRSIFVMLIFFSALPTVNYMTDLFVFQQALFSSEAATFVMMYFIGAYIRKYPMKIKTRNLAILAVFFTLAAPAVNTLWSSQWSPFLILHPERSYPFDTYVGPVVDSRNLLCVAQAVSVFALFTKFDFKNAVVNKIASLTYGGYLIHIFYVYLLSYILFRLNISEPYIPILLSRWVICVVLSLATEFVRQSIVKTTLTKLRV